MRRRRGLYRATLRSIFRHSRTTCAWRPRWSRLRTREDAGREWPRRGCNRFVAGCNRESGQNRLQVATQSKSRLAGGCVTVSKLDNTKSRDFKSRPATGRVEATLGWPRDRQRHVQRHVFTIAHIHSHCHFQIYPSCFSNNVSSFHTLAVVLLMAEPLIFALFAVWYQEKFGKI